MLRVASMAGDVVDGEVGGIKTTIRDELLMDVAEYGDKFLVESRDKVLNL